MPILALLNVLTLPQLAVLLMIAALAVLFVRRVQHHLGRAGNPPARSEPNGRTAMDVAAASTEARERLEAFLHEWNGRLDVKLHLLRESTAAAEAVVEELRRLRDLGSAVEWSDDPIDGRIHPDSLAPYPRNGDVEAFVPHDRSAVGDVARSFRYDDAMVVDWDPPPDGREPPSAPPKK
ncbi:MAG: hypothetical protein ACRC1K_06725 [Planctomycetia bacterium]